MTDRLTWLGPVAATAATGVLCAITAAVTVGGTDSEYAWLEATARALMVAAPILVGLYARRHPPFERFGILLVGAGALWFLTTLSGSRDEVAYSAGRVAAWLAEIAIVYLVLAYPSGRVAGVDRWIVGAVALAVGVLFLPTALLVDHFPAPSVYMTCDTDCPANAFMVVSAEPALVEDVLRPLREVLIVALFAIAVVRLLWRVEHASRLLRRLLAPVVLAAILRLAALAFGLTSRAIDPQATATQISGWVIALALPALAFAFLAGLVRWRLFIAGAMERLAARVRAQHGPEHLRDALADAFRDPTLDVVYWLGNGQGGHWATSAGAPIDLAAAWPERSVTEVPDGGRRVAAILHDPALRADQAFIQSATSYAVMTFENHRLSVQSAALLNEVHESRARIQAAADGERRRIEHDLHDGAQQRLVTLRIKLELAAERSEQLNGTSAELLRGLGNEVEEALDELRSLARGIYPAPLARGLVEALRSAALQGAVPITVLATGVGRYSAEIETAAYFCCLEAMQNAAKHAQGATATVVDLFDNGALLFEVRDDGPGFDPATVTRGVGFTSMHDRVAAVGGKLEIDSVPGRGTRVAATIPLPTGALGARAAGAASPRAPRA